MQGLMQDVPLTLQLVLRRAERLFGNKRGRDQDRRRRRAARPTREMAARVRRLANALRDLGIGPGDRVATFAWNSARHLELYLAVPCMGAVLHTLNPRLHHDQVALDRQPRRGPGGVLRRLAGARRWDKVAGVADDPRARAG